MIRMIDHIFDGHACYVVTFQLFVLLSFTDPLHFLLNLQCFSAVGRIILPHNYLKHKSPKHE